MGSGSGYVPSFQQVLDAIYQNRKFSIQKWEGPEFPSGHVVIEMPKKQTEFQKRSWLPGMSSSYFLRVSQGAVAP